jgi:hypothetical protein
VQTGKIYKQKESMRRKNCGGREKNIISEEEGECSF